MSEAIIIWKECPCCDGPINLDKGTDSCHVFVACVGECKRRWDMGWADGKWRTMWSVARDWKERAERIRKMLRAVRLLRVVRVDGEDAEEARRLLLDLAERTIQAEV